MSKTGTNIYKRKDGRWEGRYIKSYSGNKKAAYGYVYSKTYAEVRAKLKEKQTQTPLLHKCVSGEGENITFAELSEKWLHLSQYRVKQSTLCAYSNMLRKHILPVVGALKLKDLSSSVIKSFAEEKLTNGKANGGGLSPKTVRDILSVIKAVLEYAESENYIPENTFSIKYPKAGYRKTRVLSEEEQAKLEAVLLEKMDISKLGILLCLYMGLRIGEVCALRWSDISLESGVITIRQTLQRIRKIDYKKGGSKTKIIMDTPKSGKSQREIPIPAFLLSCITRFFPKNENAFFLTGSEKTFVEPRTYQNRFKAYIRECGIEDANFHSLRHTFSTRCIESDFDIKSLSEILGHSSVSITLNRYVHSSFDLKRKNMMKLRPVSV